MKRLKHSVMIAFFGRVADRFHEYHSAHPLAERLEMASKVKGIEGIEVIYPSDFDNVDESVRLIKQSGLAVSAVNLNVKSQTKWRFGSFTSTDPKIRANAVADMKFTMDLAAEFGANMISCCPLIDGHNYAFEVDYLKQWNWFAEGIGEAAQYRPDVKVSLEYKLNESRNFVILSDMSRTLYLCEHLGLPNVGATMDVGHALMAKECPAEVMCMAAQANRLFYVHFNDNGREWDWDMIPGTVNPWDLVEMLYYLDRMKWEGWLSYDVMPRSGDPGPYNEATISIVESAYALLDKLGRDKIQSFIDEGRPAHAFDYLFKGLL